MELEIQVTEILQGATFKSNMKELEEKRKHDRHVFERRLAKDNEREKRKRKNRVFGGGDLTQSNSVDTIDTISEDEDEILAEAQRQEELKK